MEKDEIQIDIIIKDTGIYASRYWSHVPRCGEFIKLGGKQEGWYLIEEVNWQGTDYPIVVIIVTKSEDNK